MQTTFTFNNITYNIANKQMPWGHDDECEVEYKVLVAEEQEEGGGTVDNELYLVVECCCTEAPVCNYIVYYDANTSQVLDWFHMYMM